MTTETPYPVYSHPFIDTLLSTAVKVLQTALYSLATIEIARHFGWLWSFAVLIVFFVVKEMEHESIYAHSDLGLGPGRLAIFQENLATGMRYAAMVNVVAYIAKLLYLFFVE